VLDAVAHHRHVGDSNFHFLHHRSDTPPDKKARPRPSTIAWSACVGARQHLQRAWRRCKLDFLTAEHGDAVSVMRQLKLALDPHNIMNPGKVVRV
jgi:D-lactate dehydrogenase (cytochrome)